MHSFAFEVYILSLLLMAKYYQVSSGTETEKSGDSSREKQTTLSDDVTEKSQQNDVLQGKVSSLEQYKKLFSEHRAIQLSAVKSMQQFGSQEAQFKLVNIMLIQLFRNLYEAQQNLTQWGFLPGDEFPQNETIRESMSKILENTALFGDMVLRMPMAVHEFYDRNREWQLLLAWSYGFCNHSQVFDGPHEILLNLMAQEVNLIPKSENFVNPFQKDGEAKEKVPVTMITKKKKEKKVKKIQRGPRMSRTDL